MRGVAHHPARVPDVPLHDLEDVPRFHVTARDDDRTDPNPPGAEPVAQPLLFRILFAWDDWRRGLVCVLGHGQGCPGSGFMTRYTVGRHHAKMTRYTTGQSRSSVSSSTRLRVALVFRFKTQPLPERGRNLEAATCPAQYRRSIPVSAKPHA